MNRSTFALVTLAATFTAALAASGGGPRPAAAEETANFSGFYLTRLGLFEIVQKGAKADGGWSSLGPTKIHGEVKGRRLTFRYEGAFAGNGTAELSKDKKTLSLSIQDDRGGKPAQLEGKAVTQWVHRPKLKPGQIVDGVTSGMLTYYARLPDDATPGKPIPAVVLFHGSNMNARAYVNTFAGAWPDLAKRFLVVGIDGEHWVEESKPDEPAFNYTYVNYCGRSTYKGYPGTDRESPGLVAAALDELKKELNVTKWIAGGHSQGGYLTYALAMHFPEKLAGAFPVSGEMIFQAEPSAFDEPGVRAAQRRLPIAIVHGKNDEVVSFSSSEYAHAMFLEQGFPALRLFSHDTAAHMFGVLPVDDAVRWIDSLSSDDVEALATFGEAQAKAGAWRDAVAAVVRARETAKGKANPRIAALAAKADEVAKPLVERLMPLVTKNADAKWVDDVLAFRDQFEFADAGKPLMDALRRLKEKHQPDAEKAFEAARAAFDKNDRDGGYAKYQEIVDKHYASSWYRMAKKWLAERK